MAEYISRETLLKAVEKMDRLDKESTPYEYNKEGYILLIESAPTADVAEVKHGEWVVDVMQCAEYSEKIYFCSVCRNWDAWGETEKTNYCPNCGAKMDGTPKERGGEK